MSSKKQNKKVLIILIILQIALIALLMGFLIVGITGYGEINMFGFEERVKNIVLDETYEIENIKNIDIKSIAGNIDFKESTDGKIRVIAYGKREENIKVSYLKDILEIETFGKNRIISFGFNNNVLDIEIYLPKDYSNRVNIKSQYGDVKMLSLENANIDIKSSCGDIKLEKVKNVNLKNDYGNIKIEEIIGKCEIDSSCGDVKIQKLNILEDSNIKSDLGDVKIQEKNDIYVDAITSLGNTKIENNNRNAEIVLKIKNDCGDIKVGE